MGVTEELGMCSCSARDQQTWAPIKSSQTVQMFPARQDKLARKDILKYVLKFSIFIQLVWVEQIPAMWKQPAKTNTWKRFL